jgi:DNA primase
LPSKKSYKKEFKKININDIPIIQVIWKYIKLPANLYRNIKCPLHNEKTWSFKIYKDTNSFYCFGCWKGWNAINFISEIENIDTKEAYKRFIDLFNL